MAEAQSCSPEMDHVQIVGNDSETPSDSEANGGGGLRCGGHNAHGCLLGYAVLAGNTAGVAGAALRVQDTNGGGDVYAELSHAAIVGNAAPGVGGARLNSAGHDELVSTVVSHNSGSGLSAPSASPPLVAASDVWGNSPSDYAGMADPTGSAGNLSVDPVFVSRSGLSPLEWDLHLATDSPLLNAGDPALQDPDGSPAAMGPFGGPGADQWDIDGDGFPLWWHPGPYDPVADPLAGWDCDDLDPHRFPGNGC